MNRLLLDLVHGITAADAKVRDRSADEVTDVHRSLDEEDVAVLVYVLVAARLVEDAVDAQESQLNALTDLAAWHDLPQEAVRRLRTLELSPADPQVEYLEDLLGDK